MHHIVALALFHKKEVEKSDFEGFKFRSLFNISIFSTLITLVTTDLGGIATSFMHYIVALALFHKKEVEKSNFEGF